MSLDFTLLHEMTARAAARPRYASTYDALQALYPLLSVGGYVVFDDWKFAQASPSMLRNPYPLPRAVGSRGRVTHLLAHDHALTFA